MKQLTMKLLLVSLILFSIIPMVGPYVLPSQAGMAFLIITLYLINPFYFIVIGVLTAKKIKENWFQPLLALALFVVFTRLIYGVFEPVLIMMNIVACAMAMLTTYVAVTVMKRTRGGRRW